METAPSTGRQHFQGYVQFETSVRITGAQRTLGCPGIHMEKRRGTTAEAIAYTQKETSAVPGTWFEHGRRPLGKGTSGDLRAAVEILQAGGTVRNIAVGFPILFVRSYRGLDALFTMLNPPKVRKIPRVIALVGDPGTGKSECAFRCFPKAYQWNPSANGCSYASGYLPEQTICIFDDMPLGLSIQYMLRLLDRFPLYVNTQGKSVPWNVETIVLTSNFEPTTWFPNARQVSQEALVSRITYCFRGGFHTLDLGSLAFPDSRISYTAQEHSDPPPIGVGGVSGAFIAPLLGHRDRQI